MFDMIKNRTEAARPTAQRTIKEIVATLKERVEALYPEGNDTNLINDLYDKTEEAMISMETEMFPGPKIGEALVYQCWVSKLLGEDFKFESATIAEITEVDKVVSVMEQEAKIAASSSTPVVV